MRILFFLLLLSLSLSSFAEDKPATTPQEPSALVSFANGKGDYGFRDQSGNIVIKQKYSNVFSEFEGKIAFVEDKKEGIVAIDRKGRIVLKPYIFDNGPDYISDGLFRFVEKDKFGFANADGKKVIPAQFDFANPFDDNGRAEFCMGCRLVIKPGREHKDIEGGKWGLINESGKVIVPPQYEHNQLYEHYYPNS